MPITLLTQPPPALTPSELAEISAATPSTFEGIPPLLRHKEEEVEFNLEPAFEGFLGGKGSLWVTEGAVSFFSSRTSSGISIPYPNITLHAISRAPLRSFIPGSDEVSSSGGGPCIYCQLDENEGEGEMDEEVDSSRELIIIPADASNVDKIFDALSLCASLHPPPSSDNDIFAGLDPASTVFADASDGIEELTEAEEANLMSSAGRAALAHLESIIQFSAPHAAVSQPNGAYEENAVPNTNGDLLSQ